MILVLAGCTAPPSSLPATITVGSSAAYDLDYSSHSANVTFKILSPYSTTFPDGRSGDVVPVRLDGVGKFGSFVRVAEYSLLTKELQRNGDLAVLDLGSEQFRADSRYWIGDDSATPDPFRCMLGVAVPAFLGASTPVEVEVSDAPGVWPATFAWTLPDGASCVLSRRSFEAGATVIPWGTGDDLTPLQARTTPLRDGVPPADHPLSISLDDADRLARGEPSSLLWFRDHADAWIIDADYVGPFASVPPSEGTKWSIVYGSPATGSTLWLSVQGNLGGVVTAARLEEGTREFIPRPADTGDVVALSRIFDEPWATTLPADVRGRIGWTATEAAVDLGTDDAALWQIAWDLESHLFSAKTGGSLAHIRSDEVSLPDPYTD